VKNKKIRGCSINGYNRHTKKATENDNKKANRKR
jgi:hypothetical protein